MDVCISSKNELNVLMIDNCALITHEMADRLSDLRQCVHLYTPNNEPDMLVLTAKTEVDLMLLGLNTLEDDFNALNLARMILPGCPIIAVSKSIQFTSVVNAFKCGAQGYLSLSEKPNVIFCALQLVSSGGIYVPPELLGILCAIKGDIRYEFDQEASEDFLHRNLTRRQEQVFSLMARGLSNKAIAKKLNCAEATVKTHITAILKILHAKNRTEASYIFDKRGPTLQQN